MSENQYPYVWGELYSPFFFRTDPFFLPADMSFSKKAGAKKRYQPASPGYACRNMFAAISRISSSDSFGS
jgi:hypothetical protein